MLTVTDRAKEELRNLLSSSVDWPGARLRLIDRGGGRLGLGVDIELPGDHIVDYEGTKLLVVEPGLATNISATLDVNETPDGAELVICEGS